MPPKTIGDDQYAKIFVESESVLIMGSDVAWVRESDGSHNGNAWLIQGDLARDATASNQFAWQGTRWFATPERQNACHNRGL